MNSSTSPVDIRDDHLAMVQDILYKHLPRDVKVWVFGSRANWTTKDSSDLDLALEGTANLDHKVMVGLEAAFEESELPYTVDVVDLNAVSHTFKQIVKEQRVPLPLGGNAIRQQKYVAVQKEASLNADLASEWQNTDYGAFRHDFQIDSLSNLCDQDGGIQTGPFGSQLHQKDYVSVGTPIITVEHLDENRIINSNIPYVSDSDRDRLSKYSLRRGDIVFSRVGSVDRRALVREAEEGWLFSGRCLRVRPDPEKIDPAYLSYFFGLPAFQEHIRSIAVGATMPSLNTQILGSVAIAYPPLREQRAIAHVLGTLDDKIEMNRRMNQTLEQMARALFKSWFVDFDPVRAKMEGRNTGLPPDIAALFPDRLVPSELGEIPEGWEVKSLGEVVKVVGGTTPSTKVKDYWEGGTHCWATPKDLSGLSSPVLLDTERKITDAGLEQIGSGLLPIGTVLMSSRAPIGYLALSEIPVAVNQGFIAMPPRKGISNHFLLQWCKASLEEIVNFANGSTFLEISKGNFRQIPLTMPDALIMKAFHGLATKLHDKLVSNERGKRLLHWKRESLLSKLVSGELRVGDVLQGSR